MAVEFCSSNVRDSFTSFRAILAHLIALFIIAFTLVGSSSAQALPCFEGTLPTGDLQHPQQLIQVCIPPVGWNGQLVIYSHGFVAPQLPLALPTAELAGIGGNSTLATLLQSGFAFATTSFRKNGYAVEQAAQDINALLGYFK